MSGYSGTLLAHKLGIVTAKAPGDVARVALIGAPDGFVDRLRAPDPTRVFTTLRPRPFDVIVFFALSAATLARRVPALRRAFKPAGGLWIAWPKRSSGVLTDVTETVLRELILPTGLVDNKVCAIDETWSGLRFVVRLSDRPVVKLR